MPGDVSAAIAERMVARRKEHKLSQTALARKSGVSLGSIRRFEQQHEISLTALINIAFALSCEQDFETLFSQPYYELSMMSLLRGRGKRDERDSAVGFIG